MGLREELLAQGCIEKKNRKGTIYYENSSGEIVAKVCRKCDKVTYINDFWADKKAFASTRGECSSCSHVYRYTDKVKEYRKKWREDNADRLDAWYKANHERRIEQKRQARRANPEHYRKVHQEWRHRNPEKIRTKDSNRRARVKKLPNNLTDIQWKEVLAKFDNSCALSGKREDVQIDHVIPIATGHRGTVLENILPLNANLNASKQDKNIFEWFQSNKLIYNLDQERFDATIEYLAEVNKMTVDDYKKYYDGCFENTE